MVTAVEDVLEDMPSRKKRNADWSICSTAWPSQWKEGLDAKPWLTGSHSREMIWRNWATVRILMVLYSNKVSRSLSPLTILMQFPLSAQERNLSSSGSLQTWILLSDLMRFILDTIWVRGINGFFQDTYWEDNPQSPYILKQFPWWQKPIGSVSWFLQSISVACTEEIAEAMMYVSTTIFIYASELPLLQTLCLLRSFVWLCPILWFWKKNTEFWKGRLFNRLEENVRAICEDYELRAFVEAQLFAYVLWNHKLSLGW